jgi:spermidine/putrescine transport system ATP-binding protein
MLDENEATEPGAHTERGLIRAVNYVGMVTRYSVELDDGGELMVIRQNLETTSSQALEAQGRRVQLAWRPEHTYVIDAGGDTEDQDE